MKRLDPSQENLMQTAEECRTSGGKYSANILRNTFLCSEFYSQHISTPHASCHLSSELQVPTSPESDKALIPCGNDAWHIVHFICSVLLDLEQTKFGKWKKRSYKITLIICQSVSFSHVLIKACFKKRCQNCYLDCRPGCMSCQMPWVSSFHIHYLLSRYL